MDTEDFLSSLLEEEDNTGTICPSHSPLGSDSGISDDSSTGVGNNNVPGCQSPHSSDSDIVPSPSYSQPSPVHSDPALAPGEFHTESPESLTVQTDHSYSLLQSGGRDTDVLESVRAEKLDTDVFIDLGTRNPRTASASLIVLNAPTHIYSNKSAAHKALKLLLLQMSW